MSGKLTWKKPNGEWGIEGVDLTALQPAAYAAIAKLKDIEHPSCPTNGDMVRRMTDEELAAVIMCPYDGAPEHLYLCTEPGGCIKCVLHWLGDPA